MKTESALNVLIVEDDIDARPASERLLGSVAKSSGVIKTEPNFRSSCLSVKSKWVSVGYLSKWFAISRFASRPRISFSFSVRLWAC